MLSRATGRTRNILAQRARLFKALIAKGLRPQPIVAMERPVTTFVEKKGGVPKASVLDMHDKFYARHVGPTKDQDIKKMLDVTGYPTVDALIDATVPASIRSKRELKIQEFTESEALSEFKSIMGENKIYRSHIGAGYYGTITPPVILRNVIENPGWYTPYTPYQAEIAQGRLEMLLNYQTMVADLTGLPVSNASLLDEGTAAAEAMFMVLSSAKDNQRVFLVADDCHPQTIDVVKTRAEGFNVKVKVVPREQFDFSAGDVFGVLVQYPNTFGRVDDFRALTQQAHAAGAKVIAATDLLALTLLTPPGEWGADVALGNAQRLGVPMGYGGPHAAFFATTENFKRKMPGRVIGVSRDARGKPALRMAMQTREQHIRREKATSNICTAQALLSNTSASYAIYHGPEGLKTIATRVHALAKTFAAGVQRLGFRVAAGAFFDTVHMDLSAGQTSAADVVAAAHRHRINVRQATATSVCVSFDETHTAENVEELFNVLAEAKGLQDVSLSARALAAEQDLSVPAGLARQSSYLTHPVFHKYHSETEMLRYLYHLQGKDLSLATAMIPLGSCTMKLNATAEMIPVTWPEVNSLHPFAPADQTRGYQKMLQQLNDDLAQITGFYAVSFMPNAGSQGEYTGLLAISAYHKARGQAHRNVCLIPTSAHGTNPASAVMTGMKVVTVACDAKGNVDVADLKAKADKYKDTLAALMVTYPSTHGVFESAIKDICETIHAHGGQVYMDGANLNAQVGLCSPGEIGADVCHLNLHKTFCIPHGGGGPGMGPIAVAKHLAPFLPNHVVIPTGGEQGVGAVSAAPFGSTSILPISWMYIKMMGGHGLTQATKLAILSANYMAKRLESHYPILYRGENGTVAHEFIIDLRPLKAASGISEEDVAKRLMDYNFHAPTMSFPVAGTLMVEPTESESLYEVDRFVDAMISIRQEIREVETGAADKLNNVLKHAPHTADVVLSDKWDRPYPREKAAYPLAYLRGNKFWPSVARLDNVFGDRNVICTCPPIESYSSQ